MCTLINIKTPFNKTGKVADIKKNHILNIAANADKCNAIDRIVLFGSALEERCTSESDIDIAVFGSKTRYQMFHSKAYHDFKNQIYDFDDCQDYDILYFQSGKTYLDNIMSDINNGLIIYQKKECS